ncbi:MAG: EVE domain-containing protein [Bdellovibrio sp.]|nr:EVE domain-containing protein [Bdellovibrio sp.]
MAKKYWLMKSEPDTFSLDQLKKDKTTWWEGVRNYQARNYMMKDMQVADEVLFYHSNAEPPGVAGLATISKLAEADQLQFDKKSDVYDPKATKEKPNWFCTEVKFKTKFKNFISLDHIRQNKKLAEMLVIKKGSRLSIQPVTKAEYDQICQLGQA